MNLEEINYDILEDLAGQHRTYFVTSMLSDRLAATPPAELILYAYGVLAAGPEAEDFRSERDVRDHEGRADCETSQHFWRGVCDQRATMGMFKNRKARARGTRSEYDYPYFEVRGTQLLLGRLLDWLQLYAGYWSEDSMGPDFLRQVDSERGLVRLTGAQAQAVVMSLHDGAHVGQFVERAETVAEWRPLRGWSVAKLGRRRVDLSGLARIPGGVFDAR